MLALIIIGRIAVVLNVLALIVGIVLWAIDTVREFREE